MIQVADDEVLYTFHIFVSFKFLEWFSKTRAQKTRRNYKKDRRDLRVKKLKLMTFTEFSSLGFLAVIFLLSIRYSTFYSSCF